ncbi:ARM repeat-containing protein [Trametes coccinea BRFM310]|uniref:ARM repeat-containing protein n=1 Tax=Trametes coccinea (strain BRFM310) TaxID=1353009 RepID=A0A1Y2J5P8_TRAC3|nr:ARM repeat-containing protein [Trametes coccinea BRFM310]
MGILFSLIFPAQFMSSQYSPASTFTDDSRSPSPELDPALELLPTEPLLPPDEDIPDPSPPSSPRPAILASPPLETQAYTPHALGIGIYSPQPVLGRFAPISRASLSPIQVRMSPAEPRSNPFESLASPRERGSTNPFDIHALNRESDGEQVSSPPPPSMRYVGDSSAKSAPSEQNSLANYRSGSPTALRIAIPPPNAGTSTSTPSPPLMPPPANDPVASTVTSDPDPDPGPSGTASDSEGASDDMMPPPTDLNFDFTEFDTEGYSALEKIYLFSRSRAGFHRVFIAHALPRYLLGAETATSDLPSREQIEQITPSEAVDYVLPLLNNLATDDDEAVKEALAAELVPIIWWFITHCKLVEDDTAVQPPLSPPITTPRSPSMASSSDGESIQPPPLELPQREEVLDAQEVSSSLAASDAGTSTSSNPSDGSPTVISVQAFTPLLGTLLLSPHTLVSGPARYAVVELLRRLRRADQVEDEERASMSSTGGSSNDMQVDSQEVRRMASPTPSQSTEDPDADEHPDVGLFQRNERRLFEHELVYQVVIGMGRLDMDEGRADFQDGHYDEMPGSGVTTAVPTPQANTVAAGTDSYFPTTATFGLTTDSPLPMSATTSPSVQAADSLPTGTIAPSPAPSPSPSVSSASSASSNSSTTDSPATSNSSTPSLTSSSSTSSSGYSDAPDYGRSRRMSIDLSDIPKGFEPPMPKGIDELSGAAIQMPDPDGWARPNPLSRQAVLPTTPPFEVPPPPPPQQVPAPVPGVPESMAVSGLPILQVQSPSASPLAEAPPAQPEAGWLGQAAAGGQEAGMLEGESDGGSDVNEEASMGRLSSMSLMAAVTASGSIGEETKAAFVAEVERVGRDPIYWVRREASFAVGALAKVVPVEVVTSSLLPLFESLCRDPTWHVRHSVLFALPAILSRLSPEHRRRLALDVILPLSNDDEPTVRSAVLEALGEVMYTFADDEGGPPNELLKLFLGIREIEDISGGQDTRAPAKEESASSSDTRNVPQPPSATSTSTMSSAWSDYGTDGGSGPDIYDDPQRPLVCAFNYPAVTLTLGKDRWHELRPLYRTLAQSPAFKVRRTLAASLGEMAKIIGEEHSRADLMDVWRSSLNFEECEVRMKTLGAIQMFVRAIGLPERAEVARDLVEAFSNGKLSSWREREMAAKALAGLVEVEGIDGEVLRRMLVSALEDRTAAVREAAVAALPAFVREWRDRQPLLDELRADIRAFALADQYRKRTTYVMCIQELFALDLGDIAARSEAFWSTLAQLCRDPIVDVRIRVARLLGLISDRFGRDDSDIAAKAVSLARDLAQDDSHEVRAFAAAVVASASSPSTNPSGSTPGRPTPTAPPLPPRIGKTAATFSRPPPPSNPNS